MSNLNEIFESIKAIPGYTKEHLPEIAAYAASSTVVTVVALRCFGKSKAASAFGLVSVTFYYRDTICLIYTAFIKTRVLAISVAVFTLPFLGPVLALPTAIGLALSFLKHEIQQVRTISSLETLIASLSQVNEELNKRVLSYDEMIASVETSIENQVKNNKGLATLYATIKKNSEQVGEVIGHDKKTILQLSSTLKHLGEMLLHIEKEGLIEDVIQASHLKKSIEEGQTKLAQLEKQIYDTTQRVNQSSDRLNATTERLVAAVAVLEQKNRQEREEEAK